MKIKEVFNRITENWPVKASCFLMALCLYVFYTLSIQDSKTFTVPLTIQSKNGIAVAGNYPKRVRVTLKGKTEDIASVRESEVSAYLDLNYLASDGTYKLPVLVDLSQQALLLETLEVHVSPQEVSLKVEEEISAYVPVTALIKGTPAHGYELAETIVEPDEVLVKGPRSQVLNCTRLQTQAVSIKNANSDVVKTVKPDNLGSTLHLAENKELTVKALIVPSIYTRRFENYAVYYANVPDGFSVYPPNINVSFVLKGRVADLEKYNPPSSSLYIDFSEFKETGSYEAKITAAFPQAYEVVEAPPLKATVELRKIDSNAEFEQKIEDIIESQTPEELLQNGAEEIQEQDESGVESQ